jgi:hypothetical protein
MHHDQIIIAWLGADKLHIKHRSFAIKCRAVTIMVFILVRDNIPEEEEVMMENNSVSR